MDIATNILEGRADNDTLGGRIWRARDALDLTGPQLARRLGVKAETIAAWESDRSEPRANRLIMLAGVLGVSPAWLLSGIGDAPTALSVDSALRVVALQIGKLKEQHGRTGVALAALEGEMHRLTQQLRE